MTTREKILKSAKDLFAKDGFEKVSVRDVTQNAKVNLASINYHFGSKSGLIQEVVKEALIPMNKQRVRLLKKAGDAEGGVEQLKLRTMIEAYIHPVIFPEKHGGCPDLMARIMSRYLVERNYEVPEKVTVSFDDIYKIFGIVIRARCPKLDPVKSLEKLIFSTGTAFMFHAFARLTSETDQNDATYSVEEHFQNVVEFCEFGFNADSTVPPLS